MHIPTMLAVLGYLGVSHISINFQGFIKLFLPSGFGVREVSRCSTLLLTAMVSVPSAFKLSCWFLYTQDWWWFYLKWLCRVGCASGMTSPGAQKTLPTRPISPSCCTLSQLGRDTRLRAQPYGPGTTEANPQTGLGHGIPATSSQDTAEHRDSPRSQRAHRPCRIHQLSPFGSLYLFNRSLKVEISWDAGSLLKLL